MGGWARPLAEKPGSDFDGLVDSRGIARGLTSASRLSRETGYLLRRAGLLRQAWGSPRCVRQALLLHKLVEEVNGGTAALRLPATPSCRRWERAWLDRPLRVLKAGTADLAGGQALSWRMRPRPGELSVQATGSALAVPPVRSCSRRLLASVSPSHT